MWDRESGNHRTSLRISAKWSKICLGVRWSPSPDVRVLEKGKGVKHAAFFVMGRRQYCIKTSKYCFWFSDRFLSCSMISTFMPGWSVMVAKSIEYSLLLHWNKCWGEMSAIGLSTQEKFPFFHTPKMRLQLLMTRYEHLHARPYRQQFVAMSNRIKPKLQDSCTNDWI